MSLPDRSQRKQAVGAKFGRARDQANSLIEAVNAYIKSDSVALNPQPDPDKPTEYPFKARIIEEPDTMTWGLMLGDAIHNYRSALDNAVWNLTLVGTNEQMPTKPRKVKFPISMETTGYQSAIAHIDPCAQAAIEWCQPHRGRYAPNFEPLWLLNELSNADKHRVVTPILAMPEGLSIDEFLVGGEPGQVHVDFPGDPIEDGATVFTIHTENPVEVKMKASLGLNVFLDLTPYDHLPHARLALDDALSAIDDDAAAVLVRLDPWA